MNKLELTKELLEDEGSRILFCGITTDKILNFYGWGNQDKLLKFVVAKGFVDDWCIYIESMESYQDYRTVRRLGNKISPEKAKLLVECSEEIMGRYRV